MFPNLGMSRGVDVIIQSFLPAAGPPPTFLSLLGGCWPGSVFPLHKPPAPTLAGALCPPVGSLNPYLLLCVYTLPTQVPTTVCIAGMAPNTICLVMKLPVPVSLPWCPRVSPSSSLGPSFLGLSSISSTFTTSLLMLPDLPHV